jgi:hypothetical protein
MADLSITAANVVADSGAVSIQTYTAGATITAGQAVYIDTANSNVIKLAQSDGTALEATVKGIAMHGAASGQPIAVAVSGDLDLGASLTVAQVYILAQTAGGIAPVGDLASGDYLSIIGMGTVADNFKLSITNSGVEKA